MTIKRDVAEVLNKLARLETIDRQYQAFGAHTQRYLLQPPTV